MSTSLKRECNNSSLLFVTLHQTIGLKEFKSLVLEKLSQKFIHQLENHKFDILPHKKRLYLLHNFHFDKLVIDFNQNSLRCH